MTGFFSSLFDPPQLPGFFGPDPEANLFPWRTGSPVFGSFAPSSVARSSTPAPSLFPVVADFSRRGRAAADVPFWARVIQGYPFADPGIVAPLPNTTSNMPVSKWKRVPAPVPPWVDEEGHLHLDNMNPDYHEMVTPGQEI